MSLRPLTEGAPSFSLFTFPPFFEELPEFLRPRWRRIGGTGDLGLGLFFYFFTDF
jgi:hypothetical protein